jgi:putative endonuclease
MLYPIGQVGENIAATYLRDKGYAILYTNYHSRWGEIDIIAQQGDFIVFVEVKTRSRSVETALHAVSHAKMRKLTRTATCFLTTHPEYSNMFTRFDVMALVKVPSSDAFSVHHLQDAFRPSIED